MVHRSVRYMFAALLALAALGEVPPASAQPADLTCLVSLTASFAPGLTVLAQPQHIVAQGKLGAAVSPATPCSSDTGTPYQGGTVKAVADGTLGCAGGTASGTVVIRWDNGDTSRGTFVVNVIPPAATARITSGALAGTAAALPLIVPSGVTGACGVPSPTTSVGAVAVTEFYRLV